MRAVIQRVSSASVSIDNHLQGEIKQGLLILLGIEGDDTPEDIDWLCRKITAMRIFNDTKNAMNLSLKTIAGQALIISQFTLHASTKKGNRPSFMKAAKPEIAKPLYLKFIHTFENTLGHPVATGIFGTDMQVQLCNDGPVTIIIDSKDRQ